MNDKQFSVEQRLKRIEDYVEIQQLIASYGPAADSRSLDVLRDLWVKNGTYDVGGYGFLQGKDVLKMFDGPAFDELMAAGCAHVSTAPHILIDGDEASATHYAFLYKHVEGRFEAARLSASRWLLRRTEAGWKVHQRKNRLLDGSAESKELLGSVLQPPRAAEIIMMEPDE